MKIMNMRPKNLSHLVYKFHKTVKAAAEFQDMNY